MRILIVDDDAMVRDALSDALERPGVEVCTAENVDVALRALDEDPADLLLSDVRMPGRSGVELLREVRGRRDPPEVLIMTAYGEMPTVVEAMREGARDFLVKPLDLAELRSMVDRILAERRAQGEPANDRSSSRSEVSPPALDRLVGRDPRMIRIFKEVGRAAANRANVLIRGESGTGKELVARAIHDSSPAASEPFVAVNCTAIPPTLLESELFGHRKGAFTGSTADREGRFAAAGQGTLFLDEVGDMPLEFQAKLLRVLQGGRFYPVGADRPETAEARIIAATHRDLEDAVEEGRFRTDLYFRIRVLEIHVPPLRHRLDDLPELARFLLARAARTLGMPEPEISGEALERLRTHPWPGNVRELDNALTRAMVASGGGVIHPQHLALDSGPRVESGPPRALDDVVGHHVARALRYTEWHKTHTAELLGISRPRLNRLIQKHGLEPEG